MARDKSLTASSFGYRKDIDGLRAIAVIMVLVFHFDLIGSHGAGFLGVDVFFVISGYLITSILNRQLGAGTFNLGEFYLNRIRRLAPALFSTLGLVLIAGLVLLFPPDLASLAKQIAAAQLYISNFYYWRTINYFGLSAHSSYLLHAWSLAVEEQFYLIYPICLVLAHRFKRVGTFFVTAIVLSFLLNLFFLTRKPEATFYLLPTRAWELLIGGLIAHIAVDRDISKLAWPLGVVGLFLIATAFALLDRTYRFPGIAALVPTLGSAFVILAGGGGNVGVSRILSSYPFRYVGNISYPLYLVHWPIAVFGIQLLGDDYTPRWRIAFFSVSIILASAIYHLIETPIRHKAIFGSKHSLLIFYGSGVAASLIFVAAIHGTNGLPQRFTPDAVELASYSDDRPPGMTECEPQTNGDRSSVCIIGAPGVDPTWLVYGDSHAWAARSAVELWLKRSGKSALFMFRHSCPPIRGVNLYRDGRSCFSFNESAFALLEETSTIQNVLLISIWRQAMTDLTTSPDMPPAPELSKQLFAKQLALSLQNIASMGKRTFIWEPIPTTTNNVPQAMARIAAKQFNLPIATSENIYRRDFAFFFDALKVNASLIAGTFSPSRVLCHEICDISINGKPLFFDNNHITQSSAGFWADRLADQINR